MAVGHHAVHWILIAMFWWTDRYKATTPPDYDRLGSWEYYGLRMADQWWFLAVPAFLFVSGYFAASSASRQSGTLSWRVVSGRIKHLVPAYVLWSAVAMAAEWTDGKMFAIGDILEKLLTGTAAAPFYYVPLIISLYILAPWLVVIAKRRPVALLLVTGSVQLIVAVARGYYLLSSGGQDGLPSPMAVVLNSHLGAYSFWFVFGMVAGLHLTTTKSLLSRARTLLPIVVVVMHIAAFVEWEVLRRGAGREWISSGITVGDNLLAMSVLLAFLALEEVRVPYATLLERLGEKSYGVYLAHALVLEAIARGSYHAAPLLLGHTVAFGIVLIIGGVVVPLLLMSLVKASPLRRYYTYAFG